MANTTTSMAGPGPIGSVSSWALDDDDEPGPGGLRSAATTCAPGRRPWPSPAGGGAQIGDLITGAGVDEPGDPLRGQVLV